LTASTRARLPLAKQKYNFMAIYHLSVKAVSRSAGRSATAAAAYRAGCEIADQRTGEIHDYTRKGGVESADIVLPDGAPEWATDRAALWNAAEAAERRKDACVAREFEVALPDELSPAERRRLAVDFAKEMANREGCAVDVAIHAPGKEGDSRNHHAHILRTTRKVGLDGLTDKLDTEKAGRNRTADLDAVRTRWAELTNERLRENGIEARVDHRSLKDQGIDREPTSHMGPAVAAMERRGVKTEVGKRIEDEVADRLARARAEGDKERELGQANRSVIDLSGDLAAAKRDVAAAQLVGQAKTQLVSGAADFRAKFMADRAAKIEADRQAELARQAAERAQLEAGRKAELERIAQERQRQARPRGPTKDNDGPDYSPGR
jgi:ATP-dependent exoDNAse (exonuclease V) alpha subunit